MSCEKAFKWVECLKETYQPVEGYPDKIKPERVESFKKILATIVNHVGDVRGKRFIDIGSSFGYFDIELAKLGAMTTGYELNVKRAKVAYCIAERHGLQFCNFKDGNAINLILMSKPACDYVLLLNTFHHLLLQDETATWEMFNYLIDNSKGVFVMMRNQLKTWKLCDKRRQIPEAILSKSHATGYIGYPPINGRDIFVFSLNK